MGWEERKPVNNGGKEKIKIPATKILLWKTELRRWGTSVYRTLPYSTDL